MEQVSFKIFEFELEKISLKTLSPIITFSHIHALSSYSMVGFQCTNERETCFSSLKLQFLWLYLDHPNERQVESSTNENSHGLWGPGHRVQRLEQTVMEILSK